MESQPHYFLFKAHFHIRWYAESALDWEAFQTASEAEVIARRLVRMGESFKIEERGEDCERCATFLRDKLGSLSVGTTGSSSPAKLPSSLRVSSTFSNLNG